MVCSDGWEEGLAVRHIADLVRVRRESRFQLLAERWRDRDDGIRATNADLLAEAKHSFGEETPFLPVVIRSVMGQDDIHSKRPAQRRQKCWPDGMDVNRVGAAALGIEQPQKCRNDRFGALPSG